MLVLCDHSEVLVECDNVCISLLSCDFCSIYAFYILFDACTCLWSHCCVNVLFMCLLCVV